MATKTVKAAGGNSNAAGTYEPEGVPGAGDDVILAPTSGNFTIAAAMACRSFVEQVGYTATLTHNAFTCTIGTTTAAPENKALVLQPGSTYTKANESTSAFAFVSTIAATVQTVDFGGKVPGNVTFNAAANSGYKLLAAFAHVSNTPTITFTRGSLDTNGLNFTWARFASTSGQTREFIGTGSTITTIINGAACWELTSVALLTFKAPAVLKFTSPSVLPVFGEGLTYNTVEFAPTGTNGQNSMRSQNVIIDTLKITGTGAGSSEYLIGPNMTISTKLIAKVTSEAFRLLLGSCDTAGTATPGVKVKITAAATEFENVDFMDVEAKGAAAWTGTRMGDCQGNSGVTLDPPKNRFLKAGGNLSATATYAATTGGAAGVSVPLPQDTVFGDGGTAAGTYTITHQRICADLDCSALPAGRTLTSSTNHAIYGSYRMSSGMTAPQLNTKELRGRGAQIVKTEGKFLNAVNVIAPGGSYTCEDALTMAGIATLTAGEWKFNGKAISTTGIFASGTLTRVWDWGASPVTMTGTGANAISLNQNTGLTMKLDESTLILSGAMAAEINLFTMGTGLVWGNISITNAAASLKFVNADTQINGTLTVAPGATLAWNTAPIVTFGSAGKIASGEAGKLVTFKSVTNGTPYTIAKTGGGNLSADFLSVRDLKAEPALFVGVNSTIVSGTTNVLAEVPPTLGEAVLFDDFARADAGVLTGGPQWAAGGINTGTQNLVTKSETVATQANNTGGRTAANFGPDVETLVEIKTPLMAAGENYNFMAFRINEPGTGNWDGYGVIFIRVTTNTWLHQIRRYLNGSSTVLGGTASTMALAVGDQIGYKALGSKLYLLHKPAGGAISVLAMREDVTYSAAGPVGFEFSSTNDRYDNVLIKTLGAVVNRTLATLGVGK